MEDLQKEVYVTSKDPFTGMWDGRNITIGDKPVRIRLGIVRHFENAGNEFEVQEVPAEEIKKRTVKDPLDTGKGEAFAGLRKRKPRNTA